MPRVIVRFEDLVFDGERTVGAVCRALSGSWPPPGGFRNVSAPAKRDTKVSKAVDRDIVMAKYGDSKYRLAGFRDADLAVAREHTSAALREFFSYPIPRSAPPPPPRREPWVRTGVSGTRAAGAAAAAVRSANHTIAKATPTATQRREPADPLTWWKWWG